MIGLFLKLSKCYKIETSKEKRKPIVKHHKSCPAAADFSPESSAGGIEHSGSLVFAF